MLSSKLSAGKLFITIAVLFVIALFISCSKPVEKSSVKNIIAFYLKNPDGSPLDTSKVKVTVTDDSINILLPPTTNLNGLIPDIQISGVSISPSSGVPQDFSKPVTYTVTAEDGSSKTYYVTIGYDGPKNLVFFGSSDKNFYAVDALSGHLIWKYTGGGWFSYAAPSSANSIVYAGCTDNNVYAFDAVTGTVEWKFTTGGAIESSLSLKDSVVYAGSDDHYMYALDATTGNLKWKFQTGGNVSSRAAVLNNVVYFGSSDACIYALNINDGSLKWKFSTDAMINQSGVTLSNGVVFVGSRDGNLYALDAISGTLKWKYNTGGISLEESTPTVFNSLVYIGGWYNLSNYSKAGSVYAVDEATGSLVWESLNGLGFSTSPFIAGQLLYISADDGNFYALNASSGNVLWSKLIFPNSSGAIVSDGVVYIGGGGTHFIYAFNAISGNKIWEFPVGSQALSTSSPCVIGANGDVHTAADSGDKY